MATTDQSVSFQPVFCHRGEACDARRDRDFCATCGADIAAYLKTVTAEHVVVDDDTVVMQPPRITATQPRVTMSSITAAHQAAAEQPATVPADGHGEDAHQQPTAIAGHLAAQGAWWRSRPVLGALAGGVPVGLLVGLLANLA